MEYDLWASDEKKMAQKVGKEKEKKMIPANDKVVYFIGLIFLFRWFPLLVLRLAGNQTQRQQKWYSKTRRLKRQKWYRLEKRIRKKEKRKENSMTDDISSLKACIEAFAFILFFEFFFFYSSSYFFSVFIHRTKFLYDSN